jgi:predicted ferric reductase
MFIFTVMVFTSLPYVRNRVYELFKIAHVILAIVFFALLIWHIVGEFLTVSQAKSLAVMMLTYQSPNISMAVLLCCLQTLLPEQSTATGSLFSQLANLSTASQPLWRFFLVT